MKKAMLFVMTVMAVAFVAVSGFGVEAAGSQRFGLAEFAAWPAPTPVDTSFAARITAEHNVIRAKYDLPPLQWDRALADRAQEWADKLALFAKLPPDHRDDPSIGENLIWGGSGALTPQSIVARWGGEAANYIIATNTCADGKSCLHFTQVVWSTTTKVGCGKARTADGMTDFVVCDYSPPGNIGQQPPFKPTPPTTAQVTPSPTSTFLNQNVPGKIYNTEDAFTNTAGAIGSSVPKQTPTPNINAECEQKVLQLTAQVEQLKKEIGAYAKLPAPTTMPTSAKTVDCRRRKPDGTCDFSSSLGLEREKPNLTVVSSVYTDPVEPPIPPPPTPSPTPAPKPKPTPKWEIIQPQPTPRQPETCYRPTIGVEGSRMLLSNEYRIEFMQIPAGSFSMGAAKRTLGREAAIRDREPARAPDLSDHPAHVVTIRSVCMDKYEVTQAQWQAVMGDNPSKFDSPKNKCPNCPVDSVSWNMTQKFIAKLNAASKDGWKYRLPTEAEWEYAARAGLADLGDLAYDASTAHNGAFSASNVGEMAANPWGLHDMDGNVVEWCEDRWHPNYNGAPTDGSAWLNGESSDRVLRGTSRNGRAFSILRTADRGAGDPATFTWHFAGFRVVAYR